MLAGGRDQEEDETKSPRTDRRLPQGSRQDYSVFGPATCLSDTILSLHNRKHGLLGHKYSRRRPESSRPLLRFPPPLPFSPALLPQYLLCGRDRLQDDGPIRSGVGFAGDVERGRRRGMMWEGRQRVFEALGTVLLDEQEGSAAVSGEAMYQLPD
jgi:hypothetical protein